MHCPHCDYRAAAPDDDCPSCGRYVRDPASATVGFVEPVPPRVVSVDALGVDALRLRVEVLEKIVEALIRALVSVENVTTYIHHAPASNMARLNQAITELENVAMQGAAKLDDAGVQR